MVEDVLLGQSVEEVLGLLVRGNELFPPFRVRQFNHPGGVLRNDLVALGVAEDGGDHGQVLLHGGLLDGPALVGSLSQLYKQIFQRHRPQLPQLDGTDVGVDPLQHPPVAGQGAGGVLHLPLQPPGGIGFKGGVPVLGETGLHQALQLLRFVGNVLGDAPFMDSIRHGDGLGLADFLAVWAVAVADGDLEFAVSKFLDACQIAASFTSSVDSLVRRVSHPGLVSAGAGDAWWCYPPPPEWLPAAGSGQRKDMPHHFQENQ